MRKYGSVMALYARATLGRVLAVLGILCAVQAVVYGWGIRGAAMLRAEALSGENVPLVMLTPLGIVSAAAMLVICWWLLRQYSDSGSWYTLRRLNVSERQVWGCQVVYHILVLLICWGVLTGLYFGLFAWYLRQLPEAFGSGQLLFVMSYQVPQFHGLLPLADGWVWLRNIVWILALSMSLATGSWELRRGRHPMTTYAVVAVILFMGVPVPMSSFSRVAIGTAIPALLVVIELTLTVFSSTRDREQERQKLREAEDHE